MGSIAVTTGTVRVCDCPEARNILKALDELAEGMDERRVESRKANRRKFGHGVLEVENVYACRLWHFVMAGRGFEAPPAAGRIAGRTRETWDERTRGIDQHCRVKPWVPKCDPSRAHTVRHAGTSWDTGNGVMPDGSRR